jgi:hypothetical protein
MADVVAQDAAPERGLPAWVIKVAAVTMLAGLLFGYDQGVISGALDLITDGTSA